MLKYEENDHNLPIWYNELENFYLDKWKSREGDIYKIHTLLERHKNESEFLNCLIHFQQKFLGLRQPSLNIKKTHLFFGAYNLSYTPEFKKLLNLIESLIKEQNPPQSYSAWLWSAACATGKFIVDHPHDLNSPLILPTRI